jgi:hypothetical protein
MKNCIIILTHPDTDNKKDILKLCINSFKKIDIPVFVFANMFIDSEFLENSDDFIQAGDNKMYGPLDFISLEKVTEARKACKYLSYISTGPDSEINFLHINYGCDKNYYWACINLYKSAFTYANANGYTHFMLIQSDTLMSEDDTNIINQYFQYMNDKDLDGDFAVDGHMGDNHLNGDVFFGKVNWWNDIFKTMTPKDFYDVTFPNWTPEEYFYLKLIEKRGKFIIRIKESKYSNYYYNNLPEGWYKNVQVCESNYPANLYFPNLLLIGSASHLETENFNVDKSLTISILPKDNYYELFIINRAISPYDKIIDVKLEFLNKETSDIICVSEYTIYPGTWRSAHIHEHISNSKVEITTKYVIEDKKTFLI